MSIFHSIPARLVASTTLLAAVACGNDGGTEPRPVTGIVVLAGGSGSDTVLAVRSQSLLVEVRDSTGALVPETVVRFESLPTPDARSQYERAMFLCALTDPTCDFAQPTFAATTSSTGRASVQLRHGTLAGAARIRVVVPDLGISDTVDYQTLPGTPVRTSLAMNDTTILVGASLTLPTALGRIDRFGNAAGDAPATVASITPNLTRVQQTVTAASVGLGRVVLDAGGARDTLVVSVVPAGRLALVRGSAIVVADFAGGDRREYTGLQAVQNYGLHPAWVPGAERLVVHSGSGYGQLQTLALSNGAISGLATTPSLIGQWYPGVAGGYVYFMGESNTQGYAVWRMKLDGSEAAPLGPTNPDYGNYYRPQMSPDGTKIIISVVTDYDVGVRVFSYPAMTPLSPFVGRATSPRWSPDGQWVAFSSPGAGPIRVMRADGAELHAVPSALAFGEWFDWTNDGAWLVAQTGLGVALVSVATGEIVPLTWTAEMWQPAVKR